MKTTQHKWSEHNKWAPYLAAVQDDKRNIALVFGSRSSMKRDEIVQQPHNYWKKVSAVGCSTSDETVGDEVVNGSLVATVIGIRP